MKKYLWILLLVGCAHSQGHKSKMVTQSLMHPGPHAPYIHKDGGIHHDFSDAERWHKAFDDPDRDLWQHPQEVISVMDIHPGMVVADIGAGTGYFLPHLSEAVGKKGTVFALDVESNLVSFMENRLQEEKLSNVKVQQIPYDSPGVKEKSLDRIIIVNTWHHIGDRENYSKKLMQTLKGKGAIYVVDFDPEGGGPGPKASHRLSPEQVMAELKTAGFKTQLLKTELPHQYIVKAVR
ncbi:MAG: methyltransferase domain-containing protein [Bdellovibrionales bacterium]|nr:methyltransferase domain-containing protein [Bdellovibrionales bacterium]